MHYDIWDNNQVIGRAGLICEGMYYLVKCICDRKTELKRSVYLSSRGKQIKIGLLATDGEIMAVQKRVRRDHIDLKDIRFCAMSKKAHFEIKEDQPFQQIACIKSMRLAADGTLMLQHQASDIQDNDQNP